MNCGQDGNGCIIADRGEDAVDQRFMWRHVYNREVFIGWIEQLDNTR